MKNHLRQKNLRHFVCKEMEDTFPMLETENTGVDVDADDCDVLLNKFTTVNGLGVKKCGTLSRRLTLFDGSACWFSQ